MSKFDDILEDVIGKAKVAADITAKKTSEVVELGKLKYRAKTTAWDIEKAYAKLGALVYEARKSDENFDDAIQLVMEELDKLNAKLDDLENQLLNLKTDPVREARNARTAAEPKETPEEAPEEVFDYTDEDDKGE
jgi:predicted  nucleic acid-binding Zn-ribbon protein